MLVYVVLSLAPNETSEAIRRFTRKDLDFLLRAARYDPRLLRHLLTWASTQPEDNSRGWRWSYETPQASIWGFVAEVIRLVFTARSRGWDDNDWQSPEGIALARRMITGVSVAELRTNGRLIFETYQELLVQIAKLNPTIAKGVGDDPKIVDDFPNVDIVSSETWESAALPFIPIVILERQALKAGWAASQKLYANDLPRTTSSVAHILQRNQSQVNGTTLCGVALLWADLRQLVEYERDSWKHRDQIRGVHLRLSEHLDSFPEAWAVSAREVLSQADTLGADATDLLALAAVRHSAVHEVLEEVVAGDPDRATRDRAQGVLARVSGVPSPDEDLRRWLADSAARAFDGVPLFPHPLTPLAKTWIGSAEVEDAVSRSLRHAMVRFGDWAQSQGAAQEELVTGALLMELETAFRDTSLRLSAGGSPRLAQTISVRQRPVPKAEERAWGCDIALLLNADIRPSVLLRSAELVQVKKSEAFAARPSSPHERWRIDVPQLLTLLERSESSSYWLILSTGEILCVTARWIHGLARGQNALGQRSVTVSYNDVRHTAVLIEQFLPELFLGTWVGSIDEKTLKFASGEDSNVAPRNIFEIAIIVDRG
ncbi:hypothetical protein [Nonomuraea sp. 10N515B]|uniref:hypothetical protein n=1 Tax=Nonomuraea sp. 10N515B TaxID=3457422 RepID=UPI003FCE02DF